MRSLAQALAPVVQSLNSIVDAGRDDYDTVKAVAPVLSTLVAVDDWLPRELRRDIPDKNYAVYLLYRDPGDRYSMVAVVWKALADTPIHDHIVWGVSGQLEGTLVETNFQRIPDPSRPSGGRMEPTGEFMATPGMVTWVVAPDDVHLARNLSNGPAIAIQIYGADFTKVEGRHRYGADGTLVPTRTLYDNATAAYGAR